MAAGSAGATAGTADDEPPLFSLDPTKGYVAKEMTESVTLYAEKQEQEQNDAIAENRRAARQAAFSRTLAQGETAVVASHPSSLGTNCVNYVRSKGANVPLGMYNMGSKIGAINSKKPEVGAVAVTADSSAGHLSYVEKVGNDTVTVSEGNYRYGHVTTRVIAMHQVIGYIK